MDEHLGVDGFSKLPGFTAIKQDGLYVGIEDPYFGVCCRSPDCVECSERASSFLNSFCTAYYILGRKQTTPLR